MAHYTSYSLKNQYYRIPKIIQRDVPNLSSKGYNKSVPSIDYKIIRNKRLTGNINLRVKNGEVVVSAPFWVGLSSIENFVNSKIEWIKKVIEKQATPLLPTKQYTEGEKHLLFGEELPLTKKLSPSPVRTSISLFENQIMATVYESFTEEKQKQEIESALLRFYLEQGIAYLTEKANHYANLLEVNYSKIEIKKVSSIWGSCSARNVLSFNRKLVMAPREIIDYVVIHEVCHLRERNHSSRFWGLVRTFDKEYKDHRRWLNKNHYLLTI